MVKLTKIYTRGGDRGETSLGDGTRVKKHDARVAAYGAVDEANAAVGVVRLHLAGLPASVDLALGRVQHDLFDLGADLCTPVTADETPGASLRIVQAQVDRLEREIDAFNADLAPLNSFVLPGGAPAAAHLHVARTVARRAEREITALSARERINPLAIAYINRLSDHLFVLARFVNAAAGPGDVLWVAGQTREG
jgi:cob(I)alamin adenosyltransferase